MEFKLAKISGVDDAIISLFVSKRNFVPDKCDRVRQLVDFFSATNGWMHIPDGVTEQADADEMRSYLDKVAKYGLKLGYKRNHETLLRFIDFTVETRGLHKAAMGDLDAHAQRMNNRIVRASSRLASFSSGEKSSYYDKKIYSVGEMDKLIHTGLFGAPRESDRMKLPPEVIVDGMVEDSDGSISQTLYTYKFNGFGYVREDCWEDQDVQRGTYPLSIPSDSIWKCDFVGLKHIYAMRNKYTHAHPELQEGMEQLADQIEKALPVLGMGIRHEWVGTPDDGEWVHVNDVGYSKR